MLAHFLSVIPGVTRSGEGSQFLAQIDSIVAYFESQIYLLWNIFVFPLLSCITQTTKHFESQFCSHFDYNDTRMFVLEAIVFRRLSFSNLNIFRLIHTFVFSLFCVASNIQSFFDCLFLVFLVFLSKVVCWTPRCEFVAELRNKLFLCVLSLFLSLRPCYLKSS